MWAFDEEAPCQLLASLQRIWNGDELAFEVVVRFEMTFWGLWGSCCDIAMLFASK